MSPEGVTAPFPFTMRVTSFLCNTHCRAGESEYTGLRTPFPHGSGGQREALFHWHVALFRGSYSRKVHCLITT